MVIYALIKNQGGMSDVAKTYYNYFTAKKRDAALFIFSEDSSDLSKENEGKNIFVFHTPISDLFYGRSDDSSPIYQKVENIIAALKAKRVLCDYLTFQFFKKTNIRPIADIHYLIRASNRILHIPRSKKIKEAASYFLKYDDVFKRAILLKEKQEKRFLEESEFIIVNSASTKSDVEKYYGLNKEIKIVNVANCLNLSKDKNSGPFPMKRRILYHGRFNSIKGIDLLIDLDEKLPIPLTLLGANKVFMDLSKDLNLKNISILPWVDNVQEVLDDHFFHIFPSFYEPWGLALTKSLNKGAICICNSVAGGHLEQVKNGENGFLVNFSREGWEEELFSILELNQERLLKISQNAASSTVYSDSYCRLIDDAVRS